MYANCGLEQAAALSAKAHTTIRADRDLESLRLELLNLHPDISIDGPVVILQNEAIRLRRQVMTMLLYANFDILEVRQARATLAEIYAEAVN